MNSFQVILFGLAYLSKESIGASVEMIPCFQGTSTYHPTLKNALFSQDAQGNWQSKCTQHEIKLSGDYWYIIQESDMVIGLCQDNGITSPLECSKWSMFSSGPGDNPIFALGEYYSPSDDTCHCHNTLKEATDEDIEAARQKECNKIGCPLDKCEITSIVAAFGVNVEVKCSSTDDGNNNLSSLCLSGQNQWFNGHLNEIYQYEGVDSNNYPYYYSNCNNLYISRVNWDDRYWIGDQIGNSYGYAKCKDKAINHPKDCSLWQVVGSSGNFEDSPAVKVQYDAACQSQC